MRPGARLPSVSVPPLKAPNDLAPKTADVTLTLPAGASLEGASVVVEMSGTVPEITLRNNVVPLAR